MSEPRIREDTGVLFLSFRPHFWPHYLRTMEKEYLKHRNAAIVWMNGNRDFYKGIAVLEAAKFKPIVVARLRKDGPNGPDASSRLKHLMRTLIKAWALPSSELQDTDVERGIVSGEVLQAAPPTDSLSIRQVAGKLERGEMTAPQSFRAIVFRYRDAYVLRDKAHRQMAELGEGADDDTVARRKALSDDIERLSSLMDYLYPQYQAYVLHGTVPEPTLTDSPAPTEPSYESMSLDELKFHRKSVATKILRAKNRLQYQAETRKEMPNPMPEGAERVRYEKKIQVLSQRLERIKVELAKRTAC